MIARDGSAGDVNYGVIGSGYSKYRRPEPAIEALIRGALEAADSVLNVGAGAGSYEPRGLSVTAVEPSAAMRAQRPTSLSTAVDAYAENLPFVDRHFDASMASFTVHQWKDLERGLREMRRVTRGPVVLLTCAPDEVQAFWLNDFAPEVLATEAKRYPSFQRIKNALGGETRIEPVPIPLQCRDGFNEAYYGRPEMLLDVGARQACSAWSFIPEVTALSYADQLGHALADGTWDRRYGFLRRQHAYEGSLYLLVNQ